MEGEEKRVGLRDSNPSLPLNGTTRLISIPHARQEDLDLFFFVSFFSFSVLKSSRFDRWAGVEGGEG